MPIHAPQPKRFEPCPKGQYPAVCVDVVDLGLVDTGFPDENTGKNKIAHKIDIVWQVSKRMADGRPYIVSSRFSLSFADFPKVSNLRALVDSWGIELQDLLDETNQYDVERLIGLPCLINVTHRESTKKPGNFFANVGSIMPLLEGMTPMEPENYIRRAYREKSAVPDGYEAIPYSDAPFPED